MKGILATPALVDTELPEPVPGPRDLLVRIGREDVHAKQARESFEGTETSDFFTLMRGED